MTAWLTAVFTGVALLLSALASPAHAMDLTGVLIYGTDLEGNVKRPIWHTSLGRGGRVLALTRFPPPELRGIQFANAAHGDLDILLLPGSHMTTLFWQFLPGEFPPAMALNLYFNGDNINPGISVVVPLIYGLTHFYLNPGPSTLSLDASEVDNQAQLTADDGSLRARVAAAFYFPSVGDVEQWRPADFLNLDRVGTDRLTPDGRPDGIMEFELVVEPSGPAPRAVPQAGGVPAGGVAGPLVAHVGADQWAVPPTATLAVMPAARGAAPLTPLAEPAAPPAAGEGTQPVGTDTRTAAAGGATETPGNAAPAGTPTDSRAPLKTPTAAPTQRGATPGMTRGVTAGISPSPGRTPSDSRQVR